MSQRQTQAPPQGQPQQARPQQGPPQGHPQQVRPQQGQPQQGSRPVSANPQQVQPQQARPQGHPQGPPQQHQQGQPQQARPPQQPQQGPRPLSAAPQQGQAPMPVHPPHVLGAAGGAPPRQQKVEMRYPSTEIITKGMRLALQHDKPLIFSFWADSLNKTVFFNHDSKLNEWNLYKSDDEFTSPILNRHAEKGDLICETENSMYVIAGDIGNKSVQIKY